MVGKASGDKKYNVTVFNLQMRLIPQIFNSSGQACIAMITNLDIDEVKKYIGGETEINSDLLIECLNKLGIKTGRLIMIKTEVKIPDELPEICMCLQHYGGKKHNIHWVVWNGIENVWYDPARGILYRSKFEMQNWQDADTLPRITSYFEILTKNEMIFNNIEAQKVKDYVLNHSGTLRTIADWAAREFPNRDIDAGNQLEGKLICQEAAELLDEYMWDWIDNGKREIRRG